MEELFEKFYNDLFIDFEEKSKNLTEKINLLKKNKNKIFEQIKNNPSYFNKNFINIIDNLSLLKTNFNSINNKLEQLSFNIQNNLTENCEKEINEQDKYYLRVKKLLEPFLPYMLVYNLFLEN